MANSKSYFIYDSETGEIRRQFSGPPEWAVLQLADDEFLVEAEGDITDFKVVNGEVVPKDQSEKNDLLYLERLNSFPSFLTSAETTETDLDTIISDYFLGRVDVSQWRAENYVFLRKAFYPEIGELLDAQVKISSTDPILQAQGQAQLDQYNLDCLAVKLRFPKE